MSIGSARMLILVATCCRSPFGFTRSLSFYLAKDAWPFFVAVGSALTARGQEKQSPILLNQLMAFGVIAQHIVAGTVEGNVYQFSPCMVNPSFRESTGHRPSCYILGTPHCHCFEF